MTDRDIVVYAAGRASDDTFFLGHDLREYRELAELDEEGLAKFLDCSRGALVSLALCRRPDPNGPSFRANVEQIALHCRTSAQQLAKLVREVEAVRAMRTVPELQSQLPRARSAFLMAARDRKRRRIHRNPSKKRGRK